MYLPMCVSRQINENLQGVHAPDSAGPAVGLGAQVPQGGSTRLIRKFSNCTDVRAAPQRKLSTKELMLSNCGAGEDSCESLGLQGDQTSSSKRKLVLNIHWKH